MVLNDGAAVSGTDPGKSHHGGTSETLKNKTWVSPVQDELAQCWETITTRAVVV